MLKSAAVAAMLFAAVSPLCANADDAAKPASQAAPKAAAKPAARPQAKVRDPEVREVFNADWKDEKLEDVLAAIRKSTGANMVVSWPALEAAGIKRDQLITLKLNRLPAGQWLRTVLQLASAHAEGDQKATYVVDEGIVKIATRKELKDLIAQQTKVYDTRDVGMPVPNFTDAPQIGFKFGEGR